MPSAHPNSIHAKGQAGLGPACSTSAAGFGGLVPSSLPVACDCNPTSDALAGAPHHPLLAWAWTASPSRLGPWAPRLLGIQWQTGEGPGPETRRGRSCRGMEWMATVGHTAPLSAARRSSMTSCTCTSKASRTSEVWRSTSTSDVSGWRAMVWTVPVSSSTLPGRRSWARLGLGPDPSSSVPTRPTAPLHPTAIAKIEGLEGQAKELRTLYAIPSTCHGGTRGAAGSSAAGIRGRVGTT